jgi:glycerol-3-phosphate dehydrogenase (NAD(P)+)
MTLAILGGGSWGTALAIVLGPRFERVRLWVYEAELAESLQKSRENVAYLPGFSLPANIDVDNDLTRVVRGAEIVLGVVPSAHARRVFSEAAPHLDSSSILVSATKGIEIESLFRMSEVIAQTTGSKNIAALSGPTFAREIAQGEPAAVVIASEQPSIAETVQAAFSGPTFRLYTNQDILGVEIAAALKNVIAIAAGVCQGLGLGSNTRAALITRGLTEITRLAVAMGGQPKTLAGLAGLGDLVLTCTGELSRNRRVGIDLAEGKTLREITAATSMVAEGVQTSKAAVLIGMKFHVDLPIMQQMHAVLYKGKAPREALRELLERSLKGE